MAINNLVVDSMELTNDELQIVTGSDGFGIGGFGIGGFGLGACGVCGAVALPVVFVPTVGACGTCGFGIGGFGYPFAAAVAGTAAAVAW